MIFEGTLNINAALYRMAFQPDAGFLGETYVSISVYDLGHTGGPPEENWLDVTVSVVEQWNSPPVVHGPRTATVEADTPLILTGAARIWVADPDAGDELVRLWLSSGLGTLTLSSTSGLEFLDGSNGWSSMIFDGNLTDVDAALDGMVFQPDLGFSGTGYFWFYVDDLGHSGGPAQQGDFYVELDIGEWNAAAVSAPDQVYTLAGVPIRFSAEANMDIRVSDRDAGDEPIEMSLECEWGTLTLSTTAGLTFTQGDGEADSWMAFEGRFPPSMPHWMDVLPAGFRVLRLGLLARPRQ